MLLAFCVIAFQKVTSKVINYEACEITFVWATVGSDLSFFILYSRKYPEYIEIVVSFLLNVLDLGYLTSQCERWIQYSIVVITVTSVRNMLRNPKHKYHPFTFFFLARIS